MRFVATVALLAGLVSAEDDWFKEYDSTSCDSMIAYHDSSALSGGEGVNGVSCTPLDPSTVAIRGYWTDWLSGTLYAYSSADCSGTALGKISRDTSECWAVDDFNGWGQVVGSIGLESVAL